MMIELIIVMLVVWIVSISGMAMGAYAVYRTKREPYEAFVNLKERKGSAHVVDPFKLEPAGVYHFNPFAPPGSYEVDISKNSPIGPTPPANIPQPSIGLIDEFEKELKNVKQ